MASRRARAGRVAAGVAMVSAAAAALGGSALAGPTAPTKIFACYSNTTGEMFRVTGSTTCPTGQTKLAWLIAGPQGPQGPQGAQGATGPQGSPGAQGARGPQGAAGPQGSAGAQGAQGATGPQGARGAQGAQGTTGPQGTQGSLGARGSQGARGPQGANGPQGARGPQGTQGAQGAPGAVSEFNFEPQSGFVTVNTGGGIVAATSIVPGGLYHVTATAMASNGKISCRIGEQTRSSFQSLFLVGVPAPGFSGNTVLENGTVKILSGDQSPTIVEDCVGSRSFIHVTHRALTAIRVAHAQGNVTGSTRRSHGTVGHRPANRFVGKGANVGRG